MRETIVILLLLAASLYDMKERKIPNFLILVGWLLALIFRFLQEGRTGILSCVLAVFITVTVCFPVFLLRAVGAGDIKLLTLISAMHGWKHLLQTTIIWLILAGALSVVILIRNHLVAERLRYLWFYLTTGRVCGMPYYDPDRDGTKCTIILAPILFVAYVLVLIGRGRGLC